MYESPDEHSRRLHDDLRGEYQHIRLCFDALDHETQLVPCLEWLRRIESAAGRCEVAASELELERAAPPPLPA
jgi:hypothetical protein